MIGLFVGLCQLALLVLFVGVLYHFMGLWVLVLL